jgi:hypothetical protein
MPDEPEVMVPIIPSPLIIKTILDLINSLPVEPSTIGFYVLLDGMLYMPSGLRTIESGDIVMAIESMPAMMPPALLIPPETELL